jgi:predicted nucleotidyltransferase
MVYGDITHFLGKDIEVLEKIVGLKVDVVSKKGIKEKY